jgi:Tfp pilus assembly protein PilV
MNRNSWNLLKLFRNFEPGQRGVSLVEAAVSIALLGGGILTLMFAMSTGTLAVKENDQQSIAQGLVRAQLEYTKSRPYNPSASSYPTVDTPDGYSLSVGVASVPDTNNNIQKITAVVSYNNAVVVSAEDYKVNR